MTADSFITILSVAGVILVTVYNIVSSKHYREAKQAEVDSLTATIDSKQAEIDSLKQFTSSHVFDEHQAMKSMLESSIDRLQLVIADKDRQVAELEAEQDKQIAVVAQTEFESMGFHLSAADKDKQSGLVKLGRARLDALKRQQQTANVMLQLSTQFKDMIAAHPLTALTDDLSSFDIELPST